MPLYPLPPVLVVVMSIALAASSLAAFYAPGAEGSGIPVVMAYLNGVRMRGCLSVRVFAVKLSVGINHWSTAGLGYLQTPLYLV